MAPQSGIFPIYLRAEYREDANGVPKFISRIQQAAQVSEAELRKVGAALNSALTSPRTGAGALDLGIGPLRELIRQQEQAAIAAREIQAATLAAANANGTFNASLTPTINAYRDLAKAKEAEVSASRAQLAALEQVQAALDRAASATSVLTGDNLRLAQAEAAAANGAAMLEAIYRGTAAEQGRLASSARESAKAFEEMFAAEEAAAAAQRALADSAAQLRSQLDPMFAAQRQFDAELERADQLLNAGVITTQEYAAAQQIARERLREAAAAATENADAVERAAKAQAEAIFTLDTAIGRKRNSGGSLDLGLADLSKQIAQQEAVATASREIAAAAQAAAAAAGGLSAELNEVAAATAKVSAQEDALLGELRQQEVALTAVQQELNKTASATDQVVEAQRRGTTARSNVINSVRAERVAFVQLGQQLQDITIQAQAGTSGFTIFAQQIPQAAFALSGLSESSNETLAKVGEFATFLSGPWGAAVFAATAVLGPFIYNLFESADAAEEAERAQRSLGQVLADTTSSYGEVIEAIRAYRREQARAAEGDIQQMARQLQIIGNNIRLALSIREVLQAELEQQQAAVRAGPTGPGGQGAVGPALVAGQISDALARNQQELKDLTEGAGLKQIEIANALAVLDTDATARVRETFRRLRKEAERELVGDPKALRARLGELLTQEKAEIAKLRDRPDKPDEERVDRTAERLADFGEKAAEQIQRINERFDEQPRLIDQAAQATRQLDAITADLEKRKPPNFEKLIADAEAAKITVQDALLRPFEQLREESQQRLQIESLLAQGQFDRASALQDIFRLEQQLGPLTREQREDVEGIVVAEQQRLRVLRDQRAVFEAQLDVLDQVRSDLTAILSGRSTDFFGNFKQALLDLQGQRLFEAIFGDAFRDIENELQKNTPQGRANAAYAQQVERTASATARVGDAAISLAEAFDRAFGIMENGTAAANDNGLPVSAREAAEALWDDLTTGEIVVEARVARNSVADLAARISKSIGDSIAVELKDLLGDDFARTVGNIIGGFIGGKAVGGAPGGIIGALKGALGLFADKDGKLSKTLAGIDKKLGEALDGAATGTQVNAISKALGLGGSQTGAQIGGALGSVGTAITGIPGLDIVGSIIGNFVGGLLKKTPRASATIGGVGNSLGITGVTGTSAALRTTAGGLGDSVLESINRIAQQLGASVDASAGRVSIGQRKGSLRVDTSGRGVTKVGNGAVDFGEDAQAAIAFAVRDLIQDGVIKGLRQSEQNLLKAGKDVEAALSDVLRFRAVFDEIDAIKDPVGSAVRKLNTEFESLITLFEKAGASTEEFASLEELYNLKRAEAIKEATDRVVGSLRQLLNDLKIGDSGLSLRDRRANALGEFNALAARVAAGDTSAFDDFADISKQLLDIERQLFGSTQSYFDRLQQVTALTEKAIADQTNVTSIGASQPSPFDDRTSIARAIESTGAEQVSILRAINDNLILALSPGRRPVTGGGGDGGTVFSVLPQQVLSF